MSKKKEDFEIDIIFKSGKKLDDLISLLKSRGINISKAQVAEYMNVTDEQLSKFLHGKNSPPFFRVYRFINLLSLSPNDLAFLFDLKINLEQENKSIAVPLFCSDNAQCSKSINLIKKIYEENDTEIITGVEVCLSGFFEKFIKKQKQKKLDMDKKIEVNRK